MIPVYNKNILKGDIEPSDERGFYFATDLSGNSCLIKGKKEAIKYLKEL
jgi:hypothetical protein